MKSMQLLCALTYVSDAFILESALPPSESRPRIERRRGRRREARGLGQVIPGSLWVAAACAMVSLLAVVVMVQWGRLPPTPPALTEPPTGVLTEALPSVTEPETPPTPAPEDAVCLVYVSHGDGTCSVAAGAGLFFAETPCELTVPSVSPDGDTVTAIPTDGFRNCSALTTLTLPKTLETIGEGAFTGCTALIELILPGRVTDVGDGALEGCTALRLLVFRSPPHTMGADALRGCTALEVIRFGGYPSEWNRLGVTLPMGPNGRPTVHYTS